MRRMYACPVRQRHIDRELQKNLDIFFQCVKVALFFFRTPVHMHVLTIPPTRDRGYTDGRVKCRKPVEEPGTAPRVRIGNVVALLIGRKCPDFISSAPKGAHRL